MAEFNIPDNQSELVNRCKTDVQNSLPTSNPFLRNSFLNALITGFSGRVYDFYLQLQVLIDQLFVDTANNSFLERWGSYRNVARNPATQSTGNITVTGTAGTIIPLATEFQDSDGNAFTSTSAATIAANSLSITSLTRSGTTATATTASDHGLASGVTVTISGAVETAYNGDYEVVVTSTTTFTYTVSGSPTTPATGTILAAIDSITVPVQSVEYGEDQNLEAATELTLSSPIAGVDNTAIVQYGGFSEGTDIETDDEYRDRVIDRYQNPISQFNSNQIIATAKTVSGVTRVWVFEAGDDYGAPVSVTSITRSDDIATVTISGGHDFEDGMEITISGATQTEYNVTKRIIVINSTSFAYVVTGAPATPATGTITVQGTVPPGQSITFFTRDNDVSVIPSGAEVAEVDAVLQAIRPVNTAEVDNIVLAPTANTVNFVFTALSPNTTSMQEAITDNLTALFAEETEISTDLIEAAYTSAIWQTVDSTTGERVVSFTLSSPTGDVAVSASEIPVLGTITYP